MKQRTALLVRALYPQRIDRQAPPLGNKTDPLDELIFIIITTMTQYGAVEAYERVRTVFPSWDHLLLPDAERLLRAAIERCGLVNQKTSQIIRIAPRLKSDFGAVTLGPLSSMDDRQAEDYLLSLPRVGKKVARCVLMYSLGRDVLPVDAHVLRVSRRIGLLPKGITWSSAHDTIHENVQPEHRYALHVGLVQHGRATCTAKKPRCDECVLLSDELCAGLTARAEQPARRLPIPSPAGAPVRHHRTRAQTKSLTSTV